MKIPCSTADSGNRIAMTNELGKVTRSGCGSSGQSEWRVASAGVSLWRDRPGAPLLVSPRAAGKGLPALPG